MNYSSLNGRILNKNEKLYLFMYVLNIFETSQNLPEIIIPLKLNYLNTKSSIALRVIN